MLVGEPPGDHEDKEGHVFVGPAGRLLDKALAEAGIERSEVYLTNAVKHFRFERQGKRRIHKTPAVGHIVACHPWLDRELEIVKPKLVVILGAVAARALLGTGFKVTEHRGEPVELPDGRAAVATVHPSVVVRSQEFRRDFAHFVKDLRAAVRPAPRGTGVAPTRRRRGGEWIPGGSGEDADAARTDQQADHDQGGAPQQLTADERNDPGNDEDRRDDPQDETHGPSHLTGRAETRRLFSPAPPPVPGHPETPTNRRGVSGAWTEAQWALGGGSE